ncbi:hypothetical protein N9F75_02400 [Candidatus Pelagibacter ubique]|nr:hypothetical protein [Candidatus Pelagibacter ubique]
MPNYTAPVEDMMFLFDKLRNNKNYNDLEKYKEVNSELVKDILEEAAKINQNLILPLAKSGDENPTVLENGVVRTPPGYKEAYSKYIEDGWTSVSLAAVVAKPDEKWGETPCAFVELIKDKPATEKEIIDFCRETLAGFKLPKSVIFCDLPKTSTGKIQKFELRKKVKELN